MLAFAAGCLIAVVEEVAQTRCVAFTSVGVLTGGVHGWMTVSGQKLVKEQLVVMMIAQVQCCKFLAETS